METFTVRDPNGRTYPMDGDPAKVTLAEMAAHAAARAGAEPWTQAAIRFRVGGQEYTEGQKTLTELGVTSGSVIELVV